MGSPDETEKDALTGLIGTHGKFQLRTIGIVQFIGVFAGWQMLSNSFFLPEVEFWCSPKELEVPIGDHPNITVSPDNEQNETDHCMMYDRDYSSVNTYDVINLNTTQCSRWDFDRSITPESVVSQFSLVCDNDYLRSLSSSVYMGSKMGGSLFWGLIADKFGRKTGVLGASLFLTIAGIATAFSPSMLAFIILRGTVAFAATGMYLCGFVYCMELVGGIWSTLVSFGLEYSWALGYLTVPLIAWALPRWDHLQLGISVPTIVFAALLAVPGLVPESPRWLLVKGKKDKADKVIRKVMEINGKEKKSVDDIELKQKTEEKDEGSKGSLLDLFKSWSLLRCTLIMYYLWFTNNLVYYGFTLNAGKLFPGNLHVNMLISAGLEFLAYTISIFAFLYLGRRYSTSSFMSIGGIALILTSVLPTEASKNALAQLGKFMITASFAMVYQYATEMFPTVVRNAGIGSCSTFSRIGSILAPFIGREMAVISPAAPLLIFGFTSLIAGILTLFLPETKNVKLPDTIEEGKDFCRMPKFKCCKKN